NPANSFAFVIITSVLGGPTGTSTLLYNGVAVGTAPNTLPLSIPTTDLDTGKLVYTAAAAGGDPTNDPFVDNSFTFKIKDGGGTALTGQDTSAVGATYNIHINNSANQPPAGTDQQTTTNEEVLGNANDAYVIKESDFGFTDPDGNTFQAAKNLILTGPGQLLLNGIALTNGQTVQASDIRVRALKYQPPAHKYGNAFATLSFQVQDGGGTASGGQDTDQSANVLTINVVSVNDAPVGTAFGKTIAEDNSQTLAPADFGF